MQLFNAEDYVRGRVDHWVRIIGVTVAVLSGLCAVSAYAMSVEKRISVLEVYASTVKESNQELAVSVKALTIQVAHLESTIKETR